MPDIDLEFDWENFDQAFNEFEQECESTVRGLTVRIWDSVLSRTPQFYGRMTASWTYSLNGPEAVDRSDQIVLDDFSEFGEVLKLSRGHPAAIAIANTASAGKDRAFKLGDTVWLTNGADHALKIESGEVRLRAVNQPGAPLSRTLDWVGSTWGNNMTPQAAANLRALTIS